MIDFVIKNFLKIILWLGAAIVLFFLIRYWQRIKKFILEVRIELSKVSWSTWLEVKGATIVVITVAFIMAVYIGTVDLVLSRFLSLMFR